MNRPRRVAFLGGSFDPVHEGHLAIARAALREARLGRVFLVPAATPPHKIDRRLAVARDRLAMVRLAVRGEPRIGVLDLEIRKGGVSYTVETVERMRRRLGKAARLFWIIGADTLPELPTWKDAPRLYDLVEFLVAPRPGFAPRTPPGVRAIRLRAPRRRASSTAVREALRAGRTDVPAVPPGVLDYIRRRGLYGAKTLTDRRSHGENPGR